LLALGAAGGAERAYRPAPASVWDRALLLPVFARPRGTRDRAPAGAGPVGVPRAARGAALLGPRRGLRAVGRPRVPALGGVRHDRGRAGADGAAAGPARALAGGRDGRGAPRR